MLSPLRYPGGKADFVDTFHKILVASNHHGLPIVEPYAGSAAISLGLLEAGAAPKATPYRARSTYLCVLALPF